MAKTIRDERADELLAQGRRVAEKLSDLIDAGAVEPSFRPAFRESKFTPNAEREEKSHYDCSR